ncbi:hypothetical protein [Mycolicibacterium nivoides]|uniref:Uncharacterized protein n=2 Tax=Actinomycetes TaxID=1760 RepID=A0ABW9LCL8_9MYCO|nr:hypothetical protein [Mycolicibacterium nivoides]MBN3513203.1 hypothetical protein [Mycolicibacterium septicum]QRY42552.1 hypothetical protein JVX93_18260 [Mycolicibacterium boenickei]SER50311.1 hypothetical protein SAMN04488583_5466 [Mycobacterium sp. 88mf]SFG27213.1 hypothetical protein SAMN04488582_10637 [Mycobacterium sp. 455mf]
MPLIDVTCGARVTDSVRSQLAEVLPAAVSIAVACGDEPYDGNLQPGDVLIRFHDAGPFDRFDLDVLIEVKSKFFADRAEDRQAGADAVLAAAQTAIGAGCQIGVYLTLPVAAWSQTAVS